ncbi:MAG: hypothetical protein ACI8P2_001443 [Candidatus Latescibacterota bacterium]|jgi:hypothetical protein
MHAVYLLDMGLESMAPKWLYRLDSMLFLCSKRAGQSVELRRSGYLLCPFFCAKFSQQRKSSLVTYSPSIRSDNALVDDYILIDLHLYFWVRLL